MIPSIKIYTDGGCLGTPGTGAWAFIIKQEGSPAVEKCGGLRFTTNNRMEITAVLKGLSYANSLNNEARIIVYSDSQYVCNSINEWIEGWARKDFEGKANADLWREFLRLKRILPPIQAVWVKGHNGHIENERCDTMCTAVYKSTNLAIDEVCKAKYDAEKEAMKHLPKPTSPTNRTIANYKSNYKNAKKRWGL